MKSRKIILCLALLLSLAMATTGTIAYLQDTDSQVNVMTLGNVQIEQIEQERDANGELVDFTQEKPLFPITGAENGLAKGEDGLWEENPNVVDKFITVKNTGKSPAYVRTIIAYEDIGKLPSGNDLIHINDNNGHEDLVVSGPVYVDVDGTSYRVYVYTYLNELPAVDDPDTDIDERITIPSLKQVYMDYSANNSHMDALGDECEIVAISQGMQAAGFTSAAAALDAGFDEPDETTIPDWIRTALANKDENEPGENEPEDDEQTSIVTVTPGNAASLIPASNTEYVLEGDFNDARISFVMAKGVENVVFDGEKATNIEELIITQNGTMIDIAATAEGERSGKVTIKNFTVASQIDVFACKTEVEICSNTAEALSVYAGNCALNIHDNVFDANFEGHDIYQNATTTWNTNNYGISLRIFNYDLKLDNNTVTDATSHAIGINGYQGTFPITAENKIESFKGNEITVNSMAKQNRAALKIWDDFVYAPNTDQNNVNSAAQALIDGILADGSNTFNIEPGFDHTIFCIYNVRTDN